MGVGRVLREIDTCSIQTLSTVSEIEAVLTVVNELRISLRSAVEEELENLTESELMLHDLVKE